MRCPNCQTELDSYNADIKDFSDKETEVTFDCQKCGEAYTVTIAQEDLLPPQRTLTDNNQSATENTAQK